jgi:hypothetical protein
MTHHRGGLAVESGLKVEAAAIRLGEAVFSLPRPNRHHNVMWWLHTLGISAGLMHDSGFVLSDGTYADRKRAMEVAKAAGQLIQRPGQTVPIAPPDLYSEDLWEGGADLARPEALWTMATRAPSDAALVEALEEIERVLVEGGDELMWARKRLIDLARGALAVAKGQQP